MQRREADHLAMEVIVPGNIEIGGDFTPVVDRPDTYGLICVLVVEVNRPGIVGGSNS